MTGIKFNSIHAIRYLVLIVIILSAPRCTRIREQKTYVRELDSICRIWVPDKREGICSAELHPYRYKLVLKGATNFPDAKKDIVRFLQMSNVTFIDSMAVEPDSNIIQEPWAMVKVSVGNIRKNPAHEAELVSQAVLGTPMKIFSEEDGWYHVQTPDNYVGWIDAEAVIDLKNREYKEWKQSARIIFLARNGDILSDSKNKAEVSDIVAGSILQTAGKEHGNYRILMPDGRTGILPEKGCAEFNSWAEQIKPDPGNIIITAKSMMGTPYLWGGTSVKGLDCSGFVKTVYFLNGLVLSRDASLQVLHGKKIGDHHNIMNLEPGDLLFFGWSRTDTINPTHVGIYIGNTEFIHESGMVRINSLDSSRKNFSRYRRDSFRAARRIIGSPEEHGLSAIKGNPWYF